MVTTLIKRVTLTYFIINVGIIIGINIYSKCIFTSTLRTYVTCSSALVSIKLISIYIIIYQLIYMYILLILIYIHVLLFDVSFKFSNFKHIGILKI